MKRLIPLLLLLALMSAGVRAAVPPAVGEAAPNFTLQTLDAKSVELSQVIAKGPVVLVVLRGWPGYQCPLCTKQVHEFVAQAEAFRARGAQVLMVYPGPAEQLRAHAQQFLADKSWPASWLFVTDPDYTFTQAYGLRWDAKNETAYPSTFILGGDSRVRFAQVSKTHGGRVPVAQALAELK